MQPLNIYLLGSFFPFSAYEALHLFFARSDNLFDTCRMNSSIRNEFFHCRSRNFSSHRIEPANDNHSWSIVDDQIASACFLKGTDIATLTADDSSLHFVIRNINGARSAFRGMRRRVTLHSSQQDVLRFLLNDFVESFLMLENNRPHFSL